MGQKWIIVARLGALIGLFGFSATLVVFAIYGMVQFMEKMGLF